MSQLITLLLSYRLAIAEGRPVAKAVRATANRLTSANPAIAQFLTDLVNTSQNHKLLKAMKLLETEVNHQELYAEVQNVK